MAATLVVIGIIAIRAAAQAPPSTSDAVRVARQPSADQLVIGVQFKGMWADYTDDQRIRVLDQLVAAGANSVRIDLSWAMLQPDGPDSFDDWGVAFADRVIRMASDRGLTPLVTLWMCPPWANGNQSDRTPPNDPEDFGRVAAWAAARWQGSVGAWEVWNEPNSEDFMVGADPRTYADLLKAAYAGFKRGAPQTPVVFGGTSYVDAAWVQRAYAAGAGGHFDVMGTHPYQAPADAPPETPDNGTRENLAHVPALHALMATHGDGDKPIWFTEFGWSSHRNTSKTLAYERGVSEKVQADYLVRTLKLVQDQYPYVTHAYWYTERDQETGNRHQDGFGLLRRDLEPKPAYRALAEYSAAR